MYPSKLETSVQSWASVVDRRPPLNQCGVDVPLLAGLEPYIIKSLFEIFLILLYGVMEREWQREILVKPELRTYSTFKKLFKEEEY